MAIFGFLIGLWLRYGFEAKLANHQCVIAKVFTPIPQTF
jgi:hypothetical protein